MRRPPASSPLKPLRGANSERRTLDPIRIIPTSVCNKIFSMLDMRSLARCARVSRKWSKSQTLNYGTPLLPLTHPQSGIRLC